MRRRDLLAACSGCACASLAGCFAAEPPSGGSDSNGDPEPGETSGSQRAENCGLGDASLATLLVNDPGEGRACFDGATPDLVLENDRDESIAASVRVESAGILGGDVEFERSYDLKSGERVREQNLFEAAAGLEVVVTVAGDSFDDRWESRSCRRHGIVIASDGIDAGWVEPLQGPADTQHDCYPGDEIALDAVALERARTATVEIVDLCTGARFEETYDLEANAHEWIRGELESGGIYDVTVDVEDGASETYAFREGCWGLNAAIDTDGSVQMSPFAID